MLQVMDNHYVPNLTIGPMVCKALRKYGITAPIDVSIGRCQRVLPLRVCAGGPGRREPACYTAAGLSELVVFRQLSLTRTCPCKPLTAWQEGAEYVRTNPHADPAPAWPQVHLMVSPVDAIIGEFAAAGASFITFHPEATGHVDRSLSLVRASGCK